MSQQLEATTPRATGSRPTLQEQFAEVLRREDDLGRIGLALVNIVQKELEATSSQNDRLLSLNLTLAELMLMLCKQYANNPEPGGSAMTDTTVAEEADMAETRAADGDPLEDLSLISHRDLQGMVAVLRTEKAEVQSDLDDALRHLSNRDARHEEHKEVIRELEARLRTVEEKNAELVQERDQVSTALTKTLGQKAEIESQLKREQRRVLRGKRNEAFANGRLQEANKRVQELADD